MSPRARAAVASALALTLAFLAVHSLWLTRALRDYDRLAEPAAGSAPDPPAIFAEADPYMWVHYVREMIERGDPRPHVTTIDNAPDGREVHWSSGFAWYLAAGGWLRATVTGEPFARALERWALVANPVLCALFVLTSTLALARRSGAAPAVAWSLGLAGSSPILWSFQAGNPDHHGLVVAAVAGSMLGLVLGGAGWVSPARRGTRRCFVASAIAGAAGLWVSALTQTAVLAALGLGALLGCVLFARRPSAGETYDPTLWRLWGRVGALTSVGLYLLEYFPSRLGMRLEVNHPLHALAWWGGAELLCGFGRCWCERRRPRGGELVAAVLALGAAALLPAALLYGGARWYLPLDAVVWRAHRLIREFEPYSAATFRLFFGGLGTVAAIGLVRAGVAARQPAERGRLLVALAPCGVLLALTLLQQRWGVLFATTLLGWVVASLGVPPPSGRTAALDRCLRALVLVALAGQFAYHAHAQLSHAHDLATRRHSDAKMRMFAVLRDAGEAIRADARDVPVGLLSTPYPTTIVCSTIACRGIGSLYWENAPGIHAIADILASESDDEAWAMVRARGITHALVIANDRFLGGARFVASGTSDPAAVARTLGSRLARGSDLPAWLRRMPYRPAREIETTPELQAIPVRVYRVVAPDGR